MAGVAMQVPAVCRSDFSATILGQPDVNLPLTGLLLSRQLERAYREKVPHTVAPPEKYLGNRKAPSGPAARR
jgi:hypothetical protein